MNRPGPSSISNCQLDYLSLSALSKLRNIYGFLEDPCRPDANHRHHITSARKPIVCVCLCVWVLAFEVWLGEGRPFPFWELVWRSKRMGINPYPFQRCRFGKRLLNEQQPSTPVRVDSNHTCLSKSKRIEKIDFTRKAVVNVRDKWIGIDVRYVCE